MQSTLGNRIARTGPQRPVPYFAIGAMIAACGVGTASQPPMLDGASVVGCVEVVSSIDSLVPYPPRAVDTARWDAPASQAIPRSRDVLRLSATPIPAEANPWGAPIFVAERLAPDSLRDPTESAAWWVRGADTLVVELGGYGWTRRFELAGRAAKLTGKYQAYAHTGMVEYGRSSAVPTPCAAAAESAT